MIKVIANKEDIIRLWQKAFNDSTEDIRFFMDNISHGVCLGYYAEDVPVSMLYLVDCSYKLHMSGYIYAACTDEAFRGCGYMSALLDYCKNACNGYLCLIPGNDSLIEYYKDRGIDKVIDINDIAFDECDDICDFLLEGSTLDKPIGLLYSKGE